MCAGGAVGSAGAWCTDEPVLTWCSGNRRVGDPSGAMRSSATVAQSSATRLQLLQVAAQEGVRSDRISNGTVIPYPLAYCCGIPRIYAGLPVFTSWLFHHSMDFRLAHSRHFGHVGLHLVAITLLSRWRQQRPTRRLRYHSVAYSTSVTSLEIGNIHGSKCRRDQQGFGCAPVS